MCPFIVSPPLFSTQKACCNCKKSPTPFSVRLRFRTILKSLFPKFLLNFPHGFAQIDTTSWQTLRIVSVKRRASYTSSFAAPKFSVYFSLLASQL